MVNQRERKQMLDYLVAHLEGSGEKVQPLTMDTAQGRANIILVGEKGVVLLCDREFPNGGFEKLMRRAVSGYENVAPVFYKDGKTFFRSDAVNAQPKLEGLSLKNYDTEDARRIIVFRPEELAVLNHVGGWVQYYQPKSERLEEGIESFHFRPVRYDYRHSDCEFVYDSESSVKRFIWDQRKHFPGNLVLGRRMLGELKTEEVKQ